MKTGVDPAIVPKMKLYTGEEIPCIGMGTFGSDRFTSEEVSGAVAGAIRCGYRMFDCASCYGNEDQIGMVFRAAMEEGVVKREELYIMTKVWNDMHERVEEACRKSIADLQCGYVDLYFIHWPFPNYHAPGCGGDSRNPAARPFSVEEYMNTYRQCEKLVEQGLIRHIGLSNMTVPKLKAVLPLMKIRPVACELELHPCFQQQELFDYLKEQDIQPIGIYAAWFAPETGAGYDVRGHRRYAVAGAEGNSKGTPLPSGADLSEMGSSERTDSHSVLCSCG